MLGGGDEVARLHLRQRACPILEERHPVQVLHVAQSSAAVLDVRLLHRRGIAELRAAFRLIDHARGDVLILEAIHALRDNRLLQLLEQLGVADHHARLEESRLALHALGVGLRVRRVDALTNGSDGMSDLEAEIPQRHEDAIHQLGQRRQWLCPDHDLSVVQEHDVEITQWIQLAAAIAADRHQSDRGKFSLRLLGHAQLRGVPKLADQDVHQHRAAAADFQAAAAGALPHLEPVRLDFQKSLVAPELLRRRVTIETRGGAGFKLFQQVRHWRHVKRIPLERKIPHARALRLGASGQRG